MSLSPRFPPTLVLATTDHDFTELIEEDGATVPVARLMEHCSYGASFRESAIKAAATLGIEASALSFLMHNYRYDPKITGRTESKYLRFVGVFLFDKTS